jgi:hypothetical protein
MMVTYLSRCPTLVVDLGEKLLELTRGRAPDLLDLIVTVQDLDGFLERGLNLFERACDLEMHGAEDILDDHGDLVKTSPQVSRRRRGAGTRASTAKSSK